MACKLRFQQLLEVLAQGTLADVVSINYSLYVLKIGAQQVTGGMAY